MIGRTISHYRIIEKLGEGGMGVVYRAQDLSLDRHVALKFLSGDAIASGGARSRFIHEAKAAAALTHPNICTIYEIGEAEGRTFIAMALIEGESLNDRIERGPLPLSDAIAIAIEVAEGLAAAHESGVVHRDIKPGNIMITTKGRAKVMDFGLAKAPGQTRLTKTGRTTGTVAYMSPEQTRGEDVDHRTDIWSFGVMLYEMVTGQRPFRGHYDQAITYSILNEEPEPMTALRTGVPMELERITGKAMAKRPGERYQHVDELMVDLRVLRKTLEAGAETALSTPVPEEPSEPAVGGPVRGLLKRIWMPAAVAIVAVLGFFTLRPLIFDRPPVTEPRPVIVPDRRPVGAPTYRQLTFGGDATTSALSPCGEYAAYVVADSVSGNGIHGRVMILDIAGHQPTEVFEGQLSRRTRTRGAGIRWSPDGTEIVFRAFFPEGWRSCTVPRSGGPLLKTERVAYSSDWSPDGEQIVWAEYSEKAIFVSSSAAHDSAYIKRIDLDGDFEWMGEVQWSPRGNVIAFFASSEVLYTIRTVTLDGRHESVVISSGSRVYSPRFSREGDWLYYVRRRGEKNEICRVPVNPETGQRRGDEVVVLTGSHFGYISISRDGRRLLYDDSSPLLYKLWRLPLVHTRLGGGAAAERLMTGRPWISSPRCSPDGRFVAFSSGSSRGVDLFVMRADGTDVLQVTSMGTVSGPIAWSPDGTELAFFARVEDEKRVWTVSTTRGGARPLPSTSTDADADGLAWAPGENILYQTPGNRNFRFVDPEGTSGPTLVPDDSPGWMFSPRYSPDGDKVAIDWNREPDAGLWVVSLSDSSHSMVAPRPGGAILRPIRWSSDARWIYALESFVGGVFRIPAAGGDPEPICSLGPEDVDRVDISPDASTVYYTTYTTTSDIWLVEGFDPELAGN